ncbi:MAG: hypothetical protein M3P18_25470 [Actinomycetota bacterium]|nr:hypothetical protein [Actinomycetota bacterium]
MASTQGGLEIEEDVPFQKREWRVQRIAWIFLAFFLLAAVLGLVGPGPLSFASAGTSRLRVHYERFVRWQAPQSIVISAAVASAHGVLQIAINRAYLDRISVQQVTPQPSSVKLSRNDFIYSFALSGAARSTTITFDLQSTQMGLLHGRITVGNTGAPSTGVGFSQLVYP